MREKWGYRKSKRTGGNSSTIHSFGEKITFRRPLYGLVEPPQNPEGCFCFIFFKYPATNEPITAKRARF